MSKDPSTSSAKPLTTGPAPRPEERDEDGLRSAAFWRMKAEEARALAESMSDPEATATIVSIAAMYESMANRTDAREKRRRQPSNEDTPIDR